MSHRIFYPENALLFTQASNIVLAVLENKTVLINDQNTMLEFNEENKPCFINAETGEDVIEYTGLATDGRSDRSWAKAVYKIGGASPLHFHTEREEIYYITQGQARVIIDGLEHILNRGDQVTIHPGQQHRVFNINADQELILIAKCSPAWIPQDRHVVC